MKLKLLSIVSLFLLLGALPSAQSFQINPSSGFNHINFQVTGNSPEIILISHDKNNVHQKGLLISGPSQSLSETNSINFDSLVYSQYDRDWEEWHYIVSLDQQLYHLHSLSEVPENPVLSSNTSMFIRSVKNQNLLESNYIAQYKLEPIQDDTLQILTIVIFDLHSSEIYSQDSLVLGIENYPGTPNMLMKQGKFYLHLDLGNGTIVDMEFKENGIESMHSISTPLSNQGTFYRFNETSSIIRRSNGSLSCFTTTGDEWSDQLIEDVSMRGSLYAVKTEEKLELIDYMDFPSSFNFRLIDIDLKTNQGVEQSSFEYDASGFVDTYGGRGVRFYYSNQWNILVYGKNTDSVVSTYEDAIGSITIDVLDATGVSLAGTSTVEINYSTNNANLDFFLPIVLLIAFPLLIRKGLLRQGKEWQRNRMQSQ